MADMADTHIRIPMLGKKHSLNVASAGSVILYELLRKYRGLSQPLIGVGAAGNQNSRPEAGGALPRKAFAQAIE